MELSRLWLELEPDSQRALQTLVVMLLANGQIDEAAPYLEKMLDGGTNRAEGFMQLPALFAKTRDAESAHNIVKSLAQKYPELAEAHYAVAYTATQAGLEEEALQSLKTADSLRPGWEPRRAVARSTACEILAY